MVIKTGSMETDIFEFVPKVKRHDLSDRFAVGIPLTVPDSPYLGFYVAVGPEKGPESEEVSNQFCEINFTSAPGACSGLYYSLVFWLSKIGYRLFKADEWIEVSPTHQQYYQATLAQKEMLERTIKAGLQSAAQAVSDWELVKHDLRKYREALDYFKDKDWHSLKAWFIDRVDVHNGGMAMVNIVKRWPTIIMDFQRMSDDDIDPDKVSEKLNVSKAEAVILVTKNKLYREWKALFKEAIIERYGHLKMLERSRKKSIEQYQEWLRPYISRFKILKIGYEKGYEASALTSFADLAGQASFTNEFRVWAWKPFMPVEPKRPALAREEDDFIVEPYDSFVREKFVLDKRFGLAKIYPWLRTRVDKEEAQGWNIVKRGIIDVEEACVGDEIAEQQREGLKSDIWAPYVLYYLLHDFCISRVGMKMPGGGEFEDITFSAKNYLISLNIMLVKLIEMECRRRMLNYYIDEMLGIQRGEDPNESVKRDYPEIFESKKKEEKSEQESIVEEFKRGAKMFVAFLKEKIRWFGKHRGWLVKPGPYESNFKERLTKHFLIPSGATLGPNSLITEWIKAKMGVS